MHITMVKKRLATGEACAKCVQAEERLRERGHWDKVDSILWADESDPKSPGWELARTYNVEIAPFYLVRDDDGTTRVYLSVLKLMKEVMSASRDAGTSLDIEASAK
ncbi:MAG: hypothetical protein JKY56_18885, partial [Kofleriaceae bacterium]|nr:hypothetical protein [Kofleriaceae bacterium]